MVSAAEKQYLTQAAEFRRYAREILDLLPKGQKGRLLDIGCGLGWVVAEAQERGFKALGIDRQESYVRTGKKYLGVTLKTGTLEKYHSRLKFDVIIVKHVLEHVQRPEMFLRKAKKFLKTGGYLLVACPNIASLMYLIFGPRWYGLCPREHRTQFTPQTLLALIESSGFRVKKIVANNLGYQVCGWKGIIFSLILKVADLTKTGDQVIVIAKKPS